MIDKHKEAVYTEENERQATMIRIALTGPSGAGKGYVADLLEKRGIAVIGISKDSVASHQKFAEKYNLPFVLLSDPEKIAIEAYGVWQEKKMCGKVSMGVVRTTFIIDENGKISKIMEKVKPDTNAQEILNEL